MRPPSAILSLIQRYTPVFAWASIYLMFFITTSVHQTAGVSLILVNITIIPMISVWAIINYYLAPRALQNHQGVFYLSCLVILCTFSIVASETDFRIAQHLYNNRMMQFPPSVEAAIKRGETQRAFLHSKYALLLLATMAVTTISWLLDERKRQNQKQREQRAQMELKYLRAQMNPHFLFNALNCIYSLTLLQDEKAPDSVMKLSEMLRYVTDDCRSDLVPLQKEVSYIQNFIDFQLIRMEQQADITFEYEMQNPAHKIPPMIFQPMVENCFKHSRVVDLSEGYVHLKLRQEGRQLTFVAENSIPQRMTSQEDKERTGIGLKNVQQRLELLFRDKATFKITESETNYKIELCIKS